MQRLRSAVSRFSSPIVLALALLAVLAADAKTSVDAQGAYESTRIYDAYAYEAITVGAAAIGPTPAVYSGTGQPQVQKLTCTTETNPIRYRYDGTNPTASEGHLVAAPGVITLYGASNIGKFKAIRTTSDAPMKCTFER